MENLNAVWNYSSIYVYGVHNIVVFLFVFVLSGVVVFSCNLDQVKYVFAAI